MPSKITRFYTFLAGKVAKAAEVNAELDQIVEKYNEGVDAIINIDTISNEAIIKANTAETAAMSAVNIANLKGDDAVSKSDLALTQSVIALGQDVFEPVTGALGAMKIAGATQQIVNDAMAELQNAVQAAQQAVLQSQNAIGNTEKKYDVFTIVNENNGNGTFTYTADGVTPIIGNLVGGAQRFTLSDVYFYDVNRIKAIIDDVLHRTQASGGLREIGTTGQQSNLVELVSPAKQGQEVTFEYYKQLSLGGKHATAHNVGSTDPFINISPSDPTTWYAGQIFFKVV